MLLVYAPSDVQYDIRSMVSQQCPLAAQYLAGEQRLGLDGGYGWCDWGIIPKYAMLADYVVL